MTQVFSIYWESALFENKKIILIMKKIIEKQGITRFTFVRSIRVKSKASPMTQAKIALSFFLGAIMLDNS